MKFVNDQYEVALPFHLGEIVMPKNLEQTAQRLKGLSRKFAKDQKFHEDYNTFMASTLEKG